MNVDRKTELYRFLKSKILLINEEKVFVPIVIMSIIMICLHMYLNVDNFGITVSTYKDAFALALTIGLYILQSKNTLRAETCLLVLLYFFVILSFLELPMLAHLSNFKFTEQFLTTEIIFLVILLAMGVYVPPVNKLILLVLNIIFVTCMIVFFTKTMNLGNYLFIGGLVTFCGFLGYNSFMQVLCLTEEKKDAESQLLIKNERLSQLNGFKDNMFKIIGHDVRTPFSQIQTLLELYSDQDTSENEKEVFIDYIKESNQSGLLLLNDLLTWTKSLEFKNPEQFDSFSLKVLVDETFGFLGKNQRFKDITFKNGINNQLYIQFSKPTLETIVRNLVSNSIKYVADNGVIFAKAFEMKDKVHVIIGDNGVGMSQEIINKLLQEESYYSTEGTHKEKGTGFGINICKTLLQRNNGKLLIRSRENIGTEIEIILPMIATQPNFGKKKIVQKSPSSFL